MTPSVSFRQAAQEHPFVTQAKQYAKEAGASDNATVNWALRLIEERLAFENRRR